MSTEYYICCDECKKIVHVGCYSGLSGTQFWYKDERCMKSLHEMLKTCTFHLDKLRFVYEQGIEDEEYEHV